MPSFGMTKGVYKDRGCTSSAYDTADNEMYSIGVLGDRAGGSRGRQRGHGGYKSMVSVSAWWL